MNSLRPTWAEIDLSAIAHNIEALRRITRPGVRLMTVIKANAYGHGTVEVAKACAQSGVDFLGVALQGEACQLRANRIDTPILVLGYTPAVGALTTVLNGFRQTVFDVDSVQALSRAAAETGKNAFIHVKIDTGMSRIGFQPDEAGLQTVAGFFETPGIVVEGMFTHMAAADTSNPDYTNRQLEQFDSFLARLAARGYSVPIRHAANSASLIQYPQAQYDMVRAGIAVYGLRPSDEVDISELGLIPAMRLMSRVVMVKELPPGTPVSYGCTFVTQRPTRVATAPVGYGDGYTRLYSSRVFASIRGRRVPLIGRVCMDQCMFDVTDLEEVKVGDEVVLFGRPEDGVMADDLASAIGTINYEVVCLINSRVPRIYVHRAENGSQ